MNFPAFAAIALVSSLAAQGAVAQELRPRPETPPTTVSTAPVSTSWVQPSQFDLDPQPRSSPLRTLGRDFGTFFGTERNLRLLGGVAVLALTSTRFDKVSATEAREHLPAGGFALGNAGGSIFVQSGAALGTWALGKAFDSPRTAAVGADLIEAQLVTQTLVQGLKFSVRRPRPDGSNNRSFPSGHTASSFATATVLERHFGWKAGVPAYAFATYVGAARMSADKHHLSDVIMGAGIGLVAGRSVTVGVAGQRFGLGVAPADRGAMVTFTRK